MTSDQIIAAYRQQVLTDPERAPYYLRCLQAIGCWRDETDGGKITQSASLEYADGKYTDEDIPDAYRFFGLDYPDRYLTDDVIIGNFYARLADTSNELETRRQLWRIGDSRRSEKLKSTAEDRGC
jgi:ubiquitin carboxyl-terminal hydrolase 25/28